MHTFLTPPDPDLATYARVGAANQDPWTRHGADVARSHWGMAGWVRVRCLRMAYWRRATWHGEPSRKFPAIKATHYYTSSKVFNYITIPRRGLILI